MKKKFTRVEEALSQEKEGSSRHTDLKILMGQLKDMIEGKFQKSVYEHGGSLLQISKAQEAINEDYESLFPPEQ